MGNEMSALTDGEVVVVEEDVKKLKHHIEVNGELEWDEDVYEETVGKEGVVIRTDSDGTVAVQLRDECDEIYFPREVLTGLVTEIQVDAASEQEEGGELSTSKGQKSPCVPVALTHSFRSQLSTSSFRGLAASLANEGLMTAHLVFVLLTMAFNGFVMGYVFRIFDASIDHIAFQGNHLTSSQVEAITYVCFVSASIGSLTAGLLTKLGRKGVAVIATALFIVGEVMCTGSRNLETLILGKLFTGLGLGFSSTVAPMYLSEVSPEGRKGTFVIIFIAMVCLGRIVASLISLNFTDVNDSDGWRWMLGLIVFPACVQFLMLLNIPETPLALVKKGKLAAARQVAEKLYNGSERVVTEMHQVLQDTRGHGGHYKKLLTKHRTAALSGVVLQILNQLLGPHMLDPACSGSQHVTSHFIQNQFTSGNNTTILGEGLSHAAIDSVVLFGLVVLIFTVHLFNRRLLLIVSLTGISVCLGLVGLLIRNDFQFLTIVCLMVYFVFYGVGMAGIPWVYNTEVHSVRFREVGMGALTAGYWMGVVLVELVKCSGADGSGLRYWLLSFIAGLAVVGVYAKLPETRLLGAVHVYGLKNKMRGNLSSSFLEASRAPAEDDDEELVSAAEQLSYPQDTESIFSGLSLAPPKPPQGPRPKGGFRKKKDPKRGHPLQPNGSTNNSNNSDLFEGLQFCEDPYVRT
eukprot:TRINITY_DN19858_c0_g1_i1.p1 TRINITY_DN19858_c0_g1~~TRINITY_DN19858_c0_g1_i1.p1  ORF type:complete len:688 (+),score=146.80 TRINITY_DN19858_c0_g1_i1:976-3039(+)